MSFCRIVQYQSSCQWWRRLKVGSRRSSRGGLQPSLMFLEAAESENVQRLSLRHLEPEDKLLRIQKNNFVCHFLHQPFVCYSVRKSLCWMETSFSTEQHAFLVSARHWYVLFLGVNQILLIELFSFWIVFQASLYLLCLVINTFLAQICVRTLRALIALSASLTWRRLPTRFFTFGKTGRGSHLISNVVLQMGESLL